MSASRKAKKRSISRRHWHGVWDKGWMTDGVCYQTHLEKLADSRRRRVETIMRRAKRKDLQVRRDVRKSRLPIELFFNVDVMSFTATFQRMAAHVNEFVERNKTGFENLRGLSPIQKYIEYPAAREEFSSVNDVRAWENMNPPDTTIKGLNGS